jgi:hypothetical protein
VLWLPVAVLLLPRPPLVTSVVLPVAAEVDVAALPEVLSPAVPCWAALPFLSVEVAVVPELVSLARFLLHPTANVSAPIATHVQTLFMVLPAFNDLEGGISTNDGS